jgi:hypothetical protein
LVSSTARTRRESRSSAVRPCPCRLGMFLNLGCRERLSKSRVSGTVFARTETVPDTRDPVQVLPTGWLYPAGVGRHRPAVAPRARGNLEAQANAIRVQAGRAALPGKPGPKDHPYPEGVVLPSPGSRRAPWGNPDPWFTPTPKGFYSPAQGRAAAHPGKPGPTVPPYPEGVLLPSPGSRSAPWETRTHGSPLPRRGCTTGRQAFCTTPSG